MTLEEILKSLKKEECRKYETTDDCHRVIEVFRSNDGKYTVHLNAPEFRAVRSIDSVRRVLKKIEDTFIEDWTGFDYEIYKSREELKSENEELKEENAQLKKALKMACEYLTAYCSEGNCPLFNGTPTCDKKDKNESCEKTVYDYFLENADGRD